MILDYLDSQHWTISFSIVAILCVVLTVLGILFVRRVTDLQRIKDAHDVTGAIFSNLSALYAVIMGFTIVNAQQRVDGVKESMQMETSYLEDLYRGTEIFAQEDRKQMRMAILEYMGSILYEEWGNRKSHMNTNQKYQTLLRQYFAANLSTTKQEIWYQTSIDQIDKLSDFRQARLLASQESLGPEMWTILILGGIGMVVFLCFFGPTQKLQYMIMASILAAVIASSLFLIHFLDSSGGSEVYSEDLKMLHQRIIEELG